MTYVFPERGTKRTCQSCDSRFYDLARVPAVCPKCGVEYVEPVRPAPAYQSRKRAAFAMRSAQPLDAENDGNPVTPEPSDDEEQEPDEEQEEKLDEEADSDSEEQESPE